MEENQKTWTRCPRFQKILLPKLVYLLVLCGNQCIGGKKWQSEIVSFSQDTASKMSKDAMSALENIKKQEPGEMISAGSTEDITSNVNETISPTLRTSCPQRSPRCL